MHHTSTMTSPFADAQELAAPGFLSWVAELVQSHRRRLIGYARRRGLGAEESLDAVQDSFASFLALPEARSIARSGDDSLKFLTVLLRNNVQNERRKRARRDRVLTLVASDDTPGSSESSEALVARAEELARVKGCIKVMARLQRAVIMLSLVDDLGHEETGKLLGLTPQYVRVLLHRAREHVRSCPYDESPR